MIAEITDYVVESQRDKEDGYFKGFALSNIFEFDMSRISS